jgi:hypothetical protein
MTNSPLLSTVIALGASRRHTIGVSNAATLTPVRDRSAWSAYDSRVMIASLLRPLWGHRLPLLGRRGQPASSSCTPLPRTTNALPLLGRRLRRLVDHGVALLDACAALPLSRVLLRRRPEPRKTYREYLPFERRSAHLFFQLVARRYERGSYLSPPTRSSRNGAPRNHLVRHPERFQGRKSRLAAGNADWNWADFTPSIRCDSRRARSRHSLETYLLLSTLASTGTCKRSMCEVRRFDHRRRKEGLRRVSQLGRARLIAEWTRTPLSGIF